MDSYLFQGVVLPERAQLSLSFEMDFTHASTGIVGVARISISMNQVAVWIESDHVWDIFDLRNVAKNIVQGQLDMVGYIRGYSYEFELTRALNQARNIDVIFGIDIPCLSERNKSLDLESELIKLRGKSIGPNGIYLTRCFNDLVSAMKHADDTGFYCYRAIESLRHHCSNTFDLASKEKSHQWKKFREISGCDETVLLSIKKFADPLRHGENTGITSDGRSRLFMNTWDVVDGYIGNI